MTEEDEIMRFGNVMHEIMPDGSKRHIPRELWDVFYKPNPPIPTPNDEAGNG